MRNTNHGTFAGYPGQPAWPPAWPPRDHDVDGGHMVCEWYNRFETPIRGLIPMTKPSPRFGGFGLYAVVLLSVGLLFSLAFFFPQYLRMRSGIYSISCKEIRRKIELAVANHDTINTRSITNPGKPIDLDRLKAAGFLNEVQTCPGEGTYVFGPNGEILCTQHRPRSDVSQPGEETPAPAP